MENAGSEGFEDSFGFGMHVKLFVDIANVKTNRVDADLECVGSGLVNVTVGQQPQHLDFSRRQLTVFGFGRNNLLKHHR